jgi:hypothetical protein
MRYFIDVECERLKTRDEEGCELDSEAQMQCEARRVLAQIAEDETRFSARSVLTARVRDSAGTPVYRVVLTLEGQSLQ